MDVDTTEELQELLGAIWRAQQRGIARWQEATGEDMVWPDTANLFVWLLQELRDTELRNVAWQRIAQANAVQANGALAAADARASAAERERDAAYTERAQLVAALARLYPAHWQQPTALDPAGYRIICVHTPGGMAGWHIAEHDASLFDSDLPIEPSHYDGHTTVEKYRRLQAAVPPRRSVQPEQRCTDYAKHERMCEHMEPVRWRIEYRDGCSTPPTCMLCVPADCTDAVRMLAVDKYGLPTDPNEDTMADLLGRMVVSQMRRAGP